MRAVTSFAVAMTALSAFSVQSFAADKKSEAPLATPAGITLKAIRVEQGQNTPGQTQKLPYPRLFFADAKNNPLYTYDKDEAGKSLCVGECEAAWPAAAAPADAKPFGEWSTITRADGSKQWAYNGKALYTYVKDGKPPAEPTGAAGRRGMMGASGPAGHGVDGVWRVVDAQPHSILLPAAVSVTEVLMAPGQVLINGDNKTLYTFTGKLSDEKKFVKDWKPFEAPLLAMPIGDFTVIARPDGVAQWALRGKPLYTFTGDYVLGDANGTEVDARFDIAAVVKYFMPSNVAIEKDERRGGVLISAETKTALYTRDRAYWDGEGGHNVRGIRGAPATGEAIGITGCQNECEKEWKPVKAPVDAKPSGYWTTLVREDGSKQWAYQGYALYTYAYDKPGSAVINGHDIYDITVNNSAEEKPVANLGMHWRVVSP